MNPYWQATVDSHDRLQVSWVWRSTADVSSNHDLSYARSTDATGTKWELSDGRAYSLPISERQAEVITRIPQNSQLINQTSMTVDGDDRPWIVSYWQPLATGPVQYMLTHLGQDGWEVEDTGLRSTSFVLSGGGTKSIPAARPQVLVSGSGERVVVHLLLRDAERGGVATLATRAGSDASWSLTDLTTTSLDRWEPSFDEELWRLRGRLDVFIQKANQVDAEGVGSSPAENIYILHVPLSALDAGPSPEVGFLRQPEPARGAVPSHDPSFPPEPGSRGETSQSGTQGTTPQPSPVPDPQDTSQSGGS